MSETGTLYLVATPIGNLEDITLRAVRVLREVDLIACEDTRHTKVLLGHLGIRTPTLSLHEHNERARTPQILEALRDGKSVALVSDAGTPAISDPGAALVADAIREGLPVVTVPGPSAVTAAISLADFPTDRFAFVGFAPRRSAERRRFLESLAGLPMALVMFEAPHRIRQTLADLEDVFGARRILLVRELTKVYEEARRGTAAEIRETLDRPRGEFTLVIEPAPARASGGGHPGPAAAIPPGAPLADPEDFVRGLLAQGLSRRDAAKALAAAYGLPSKDAYRIATGER